jgi:hypothetical protein
MRREKLRDCGYLPAESDGRERAFSSKGTSSLSLSSRNLSRITPTGKEMHIAGTKAINEKEKRTRKRNINKAVAAPKGA